METFLTPNIAAIVIFILIVIYIIIKIVQKKKKNTAESTKIDNNLSNKNIKEKPNKKTDKKEKPTTTKENKNKKETLIRKKSVIPPHQKITKNDFKKFADTRIIVAEDNLINQKVITGILANSGIKITMANNGQEVLDILQDDKDFTLILMDAHMPILDGFEATKRIKADSSCNHIAVIALSGDTATDDIKKMKKAGMERFLEKPLKMDALYDILFEYITKKETMITKELNTNKGLSVCADDKIFYHEILKEFMENYTDSAKKIKLYLNDKNSTDADRLLLDIVGITANIGALNLCKISQKLKSSIQNFNEEDSLEIFIEYEKYLNTLLEEIKTEIKL